MLWLGLPLYFFCSCGCLQWGLIISGMLVQLGKYPSTGPPTYQITKVPNANHMNVMKTSLTIIPNVSLGTPLLLLEIVQAYPLLHKGLDHLAALYLLYLLLLVTIYLITKLSITYYFSACRENLTENRLSFPSAPRWVRHSYLSKGLR